MTTDPQDALENEWYIVRYSGETPEIAYNSAIYYLSRAKDGPQLCLDAKQIELLRSAAVDRYLEIVLRDLYHVNCTKSIYRGVGRSIINYQRFCKFCERQQLDASGVRKKAAEAFMVFLETEKNQLQTTNRPTIIDCTYQELQNYAVLLGMEFGNRYAALEKYCHPTQRESL
jgi:hypothetical protein